MIFLDSLLDTTIDCLKMLPFLFLAFLLLEALEHHSSEKMNSLLLKAGTFGPLIGGLLGCIPQCGFSVMASALYTQRLISMGTIVAVYLSTSDEALPIILSQPARIHVVLPLVATKIILATGSGYLVDVVMRRENARRFASCRDRRSAESCAEEVGKRNCACNETRESCDHEQGTPIQWRGIAGAALRHTAQVTGFIFLTSCLIGLIVAKVGQANLSRILLGHTLLQPVLAALIGIIPNCAASVAITELYLSGVLSFGSVIAGLSAAGGLGLLVLLKENHDPANTFKVIAWLLGISSIAGIVLQLVMR